MKLSNLPAYRLLNVFAAVLVLLTGIPVAPQANQPLKFIGVNLNSETIEADKSLVNYLKGSTRLEIGDERREKYGDMIDLLVGWKKDKPYIARVTPYVYFAAEMKGAEFKILATYKNKSGGATYHSWFVVNREDFPEFKDSEDKRTVDQVMQKLRKRQQPAKFIYHDKFSTSSYFLPSLEFRRNNVFSNPSATKALEGKLTFIHSEPLAINSDPLKTGSTGLVTAVAERQAFIAAVWDGTKNKFENDPEIRKYAEKVYFIQLPTELPNDLFVCSAYLDESIEGALRDAISKMAPNQIGIGDFMTWVDINSEPDAKGALAGLRYDAVQRPAKVTVRIDTSNTAPVKPELLNTIKQAVRLSSTELVPYDPDYHKNTDFYWTVEGIHSDAINLISVVDNGYLPNQSMEISFTDKEDLTKRIGSFIHSRMHRIRYVWPYDDVRPTVIRDAAFPISSETQVKVQEVTWTDPQKNDFLKGHVFDATVVDPSAFGFQLKGSEVGSLAGLDPMSNVSYRVLLASPAREGRVFTLLTYLFVGLVVFAAGGAVWDIRRKKKAIEHPILNLEDFKRKCRELADATRTFWREHKLRDADVVWCSRKSLDELIADLKANTGNVDFDAKRVGKRSLAILAHIPVVSKFLNLQAGAGLEVINEIDPNKFGDTQRLGDTIQYLMKQNAFSPFIGEKLEWDALDKMTADIFKPFQIEEAHLNGNGNGNGNETIQIRRATKGKTRRTGVNSRKRISRIVSNDNAALLRSEHPMILSAVTKHFNEVIEQSKDRICFFGKHWQVKKNRTVIHLTCSAQLQSPLQLNGSKSTVNKLTLHADIPRNAKTDEFAKSKELSAWLLGKIIDVGRNGSAKTLLLTFQPTALVRTDDPE